MHNHHHHHIQPLLVHCRTNAFPNILHLSLSVVSELQLVPSNALISSLHVTLCLPRFPLPFLGCHSVTLVVHLLSRLRMVCPAHVHFLFLIVIRISSTFVCSLIHDARFLSLHVIPSILLSIPLCALLSFLSNSLVRRQVSDPYVRTGRIQ